MIRSQPPRVPQASPRPYSSVPVGSEKPPKGPSYNPPLPPLKISTSNGSPGFDYHQPGDKFETSKVSRQLVIHTLNTSKTSEMALRKQRLFRASYCSRSNPSNTIKSHFLLSPSL